MAGTKKGALEPAAMAAELNVLRARIITLEEENFRLKLLGTGLRETDRVAARISDAYAVGDAQLGAFAEGIALRDQLLDLCSDLGLVIEEFVERLESIPLDGALPRSIVRAGDDAAAGTL